MRFLAVATFCALTVAPLLPGQIERSLYEQMLRDKAPGELRKYHEMLEAYARGDEAASVDALLEWTHERVNNALALANGLKDPFTPWDRRRHGLAAMLHTDVALRVAPDADTTDAFWHVDVAGRLLMMGTKARPDEIRPLAERWYLTLARYFRDRNAPYVAQLLLQHGRERLPDDAVILYESGTLAELSGTDYALAGATTFNSASRGRVFQLDRVLARRNGNLNDATGWLRQATTLDPGDDLLRVHLGRVLALRREDDHAHRLLNDVIETTKDGATAYLAAVFIGGLRERQGRLEDAAVAYRAGIARFPLGHAAYIGLSQVLQRTGKGDESREVLHNLLSESLGPTREPLWWYQFDPPGVAEGRLDALRKEVRQ